MAPHIAQASTTASIPYLDPAAGAPRTRRRTVGEPVRELSECDTRTPTPQRWPSCGSVGQEDEAGCDRLHRARTPSRGTVQEFREALNIETNPRRTKSEGTAESVVSVSRLNSPTARRVSALAAIALGLAVIVLSCLTMFSIAADLRYSKSGSPTRHSHLTWCVLVYFVLLATLMTIVECSQLLFNIQRHGKKFADPVPCLSPKSVRGTFYLFWGVMLTLFPRDEVFERPNGGFFTFLCLGLCMIVLAIVNIAADCS